jgi:hypothetical protein
MGPNRRALSISTATGLASLSRGLRKENSSEEHAQKNNLSAQSKWLVLVPPVVKAYSYGDILHEL